MYISSFPTVPFLSKPSTSLNSKPPVSTMLSPPDRFERVALPSIKFGLGGDGCALCLMATEAPRQADLISKLRSGKAIDVTYIPKKLRPIMALNHVLGTRFEPIPADMLPSIEGFCQGVQRNGNQIRLEKDSPLSSTLLAGLAHSITKEPTKRYASGFVVPVEHVNRLPNARPDTLKAFKLNPLETLVNSKAWVTLPIVHHNNHEAPEGAKPEEATSSEQTTSVPLGAYGFTVLPDAADNLIFTGGKDATEMLGSDVGLLPSAMMLGLFMGMRAPNNQFKTITFLSPSNDARSKAMQQYLNQMSQNVGFKLEETDVSKLQKESSLRTLANALYPNSTVKAFTVTLPSEPVTLNLAPLPSWAKGFPLPAGGKQVLNFRKALPNDPPDNYLRALMPPAFVAILPPIIHEPEEDKSIGK